MSPYYRRRTPDQGENLRAGLVATGIAAGVGVVSFYFTRLFLTRDPLGPVSSPEGEARAGKQGAGRAPGHEGEAEV